MGLNFGGQGLFQGNPIFGNEGEMQVSVFEQNLAELGVWNDTFDEGSATSIYDRDPTTFVSKNTASDGTLYITGQWLRRYQNAAMTITYGSEVTTPGGGFTVQSSLEVSDDNSSWTEIDTNSASNQVVTYTHSGHHSFKFFRVKAVFGGGTNTTSKMKLFAVTIAKTE